MAEPGDRFVLEPNEPDEELFRRAYAGDPQARQALWERHQDALWSYVFRVLRGDYQDAWDVLQETCAHFLQRLGSRSLDIAGGSLLPYLVTIAKHVIQSNRRRKHIHQRATGIVTRQMTVTNDEDPVKTATKRASETKLLSALSEFPDILQTVIRMRYYDALKLKQISSILGVPVSTVYGWLKNAEERLRKALEKEGHA
jgi:RNA polymerase sigma-70 factor (ECF subfamily)